jgi:hypothetical protein
LPELRDDKRRQTESYAHSLMNIRQGEAYQGLVSRMLQAEAGVPGVTMPTEPEIIAMNQAQQLNGTQAHTVTSLLQGAAEQSNPDHKTKLWEQATSLAEGDTEAGNRVYQEVINPGYKLTVEDRVGLMKYVSAKVGKAERIENKAESQVLGQMKIITGDMYPLFLNKYLTDPSGRQTILKSGVKPEELEQAIFTFAKPYIDSSLQMTIRKEMFNALGGVKPPAAPAQPPQQPYWRKKNLIPRDTSWR